MLKTTVYLTEQQKERLKQENRRTGIEVAELIRRAIDEYLDRQEEKQAKHN